MKSNGLWIFLGCCVLASAIAYAGKEIAAQLPDGPDIPDSLYVRTYEGDGVTEYGDYLSVYEAAEYLHLSQEKIEELIESGEWDRVVYPIENLYTGHVQYIISKAAVQEWADGKIHGN